MDRHTAYSNGHPRRRLGVRPWTRRRETDWAASAASGVLRAPGPGEARAAPRMRLGVQVPQPRLTALGSGLFAAAAMVVFAGLDALTGGAATAYGVVFLLVSVLAALWVRPADLFMAPVAAPLAFTAGLPVLLPGPFEGLGDALMAVATALAVNAGWVYAGTLTALGVALARRLRQVGAARRR